MTGATSRSRGHRAERDVARYLRARGYPDAHTTRSALGHDGTHTPGDVVGIPGLVIEVKDHARPCWPQWIRQVRHEAGDRPWVIIRKRRGCSDPGQWECLSETTYGTVEVAWRDYLTTFAEWLDWWESDTEADG